MSSVCSFVQEKFSLNQSQEFNELHDSPDELKKSISFQKSNKSYTELNSVKEKEEHKRSYPTRQFHPSPLTGIEPTNQTTTVICFPTDKIERKIILSSEDAGQSNLISYLVKLYFQTYLNFEPHEIDPNTFELKKQPTDTTELSSTPIKYLCKLDKIYLLRKPRNKTETHKSFDDKEEKIQIIINQKHNSVIEYFQKGKTGIDLKAKANQYRRFSKIHLLYYISMKFVDPKKKISEMPEKVFEIYRENITNFQDKTFIKFRNSSHEVSVSGVSTNGISELPNKFLVAQSLIKGRLQIEIKDNQIIEYREGGVVSLLGGINSLLQIPEILKNPLKRSIMNLLSATNSTPNRVDLEFMYARDNEQVSYTFDSKDNAELMMLHLEEKEKMLRVKICNRKEQY